VSHRVVLSEQAISDLVNLAHWIAVQADHETARAYLARIDIKIAKLEFYPERGTLRPDIADGVRSIIFERRRIIYYRVVGDEVWVERILDGRRDQASAFAGPL
jgi:toxin ParE1/3/4